MSSKKEELQEQKPTETNRDQPIIPIYTNRPQGVEGVRLVTQNQQISLESLDHCYNQYINLFRQNIRLNSQLKQELDEKNSLAQKHNQLKKINSEQEQKKKRHRRNANEVPRTYECSFENCQKAYGSEGSLTQHVKLKHLQFYQSGQYDMHLQAEHEKSKNLERADP